MFKKIVDTGWVMAISACGAALGNTMYTVGKAMWDVYVLKKHDEEPEGTEEQPQP